MKSSNYSLLDRINAGPWYINLTLTVIIFSALSWSVLELVK
jgi:hypothetical protein